MYGRVLALTSSLLLVACDGHQTTSQSPPPEQKKVPVIMYSPKDGVELVKTNASGPSETLKTLKYGESIVIEECRLKDCFGTLEGIPFMVNGRDLSKTPPPPQEQYAIGTVAVTSNGKTRYLKPNQKVEIREVNDDGTLVRISDRGEWANLNNLRAQPETAEERKVREDIEKAFVKAAENERRDYATQLQNHFLDQGLDVKVRVSGAKADRLTLQFVLFNDVWRRKMETGSLLDEIRSKGFRRLDMKDGYDYHIYWSF